MADSQRKTANLFDGNVEQGTYNIYVSPVEKNDTTNRCRTSTFINVIENNQYTVSLKNADSDIEVIVHFLDNAKTYISETQGWAGTPRTFTTPVNCKYIDVIFRNKDNINITPSVCGDLMLNTGSTALPYAPYWQHSLRKLTTATEAVENPLYSDGTAITAYTLKGNEEHTGTPTPSNPVEVNGVGVRTENLLPTTTAWYLNNNSSALDKSDVSDIRIKTDIFPVSDTNAFVTVGAFNLPNVDGLSLIGFRFYGDDLTTALSTTGSGNTRAIPTGAKWLSLLYGTNSTTFDTSTIKTAMLAAQITVVYGQTAPSSYIPYGYKIPISSGGVTTNIYLGSTQTTRLIKKIIFDGTEDNWRITGTGRMGIPLSDLPQRLTTPYCTHFIGTTVESYGNMGDGECSISVVSGSVREFGCYDSTITTLADFKTWLQQQYANGTPVTIWYVLATPETGIVNEPLMKIGTYADTLSNATAIPTTEGANSITVDTTVQPSEFTATWTGWHDAEVKEKSENLWGGTTETNKYIDGQGNTGTASNGDIFDQKGITVVSSTNYTFSWSNVVLGSEDNTPYIRICFYTSNGGTFISRTLVTPSSYPDKYITFAIPNNCTYVDIRIDSETSTRGQHFENIMLNTGSTALPYEPYWK